MEKAIEWIQPAVSSRQLLALCRNPPKRSPNSRIVSPRSRRLSILETILNFLSLISPSLVQQSVWLPQSMSLIVAVRREVWKQPINSWPSWRAERHHVLGLFWLQVKAFQSEARRNELPKWKKFIKISPKFQSNFLLRDESLKIQTIRGFHSNFRPNSQLLSRITREKLQFLLRITTDFWSEHFVHP